MAKRDLPINKRTYLIMDGVYKGSRELLKDINAKQNQFLISESKRIAAEVAEEINLLIKEMVQKHPDPKWSVWRKYFCVVENEKVTYTNGIARYSCDIVVKSMWRYFNLWEVLTGESGEIVFKRDHMWPIMDGKQLEVTENRVIVNQLEYWNETGEPGDSIMFASRRKDAKDKNARRLPTSVYYEKLDLFKAIINSMAQGPEYKEFRRSPSAQGVKYNSKRLGIFFEHIGTG